MDDDPGVHEAGWLKLDASRARGELDWKPRLRLGDALDSVVAWYKAHERGEDMRTWTLDEIARYEQLWVPHPFADSSR